MSIVSQNKIVLGIETSCDETALALLEYRGVGTEREYRILASVVHSQAELHSAYGGVYPNLAKREHGKNIVALLHKLLIEAAQFMPEGAEVVIDMQDKIASFKNEIAPQNPELFESFAGAKYLEKIPAIECIAVTEGPGLEPALWVGITFGRMLSSIWCKPLVAVDHMEGHIVGSLMNTTSISGQWNKLHQIDMPALALLISGGHTELVVTRELGRYEIIGETLDDAVGEAYDKAARLLGLPYPGGPHLSMLAGKARTAGIVAPVALPRPMITSGNLDFSFSGLKTAVLYATRTAPRDHAGTIEDKWKMGLAREFEEAVTETIDTKLRLALDDTGAKTIIVGGGVSANTYLRSQLDRTAQEYGIKLLLPHSSISGDNAMMIALASLIQGNKNQNPLEIRASGTKRLAE